MAVEEGVEGVLLSEYVSVEDRSVTGAGNNLMVRSLGKELSGENICTVRGVHLLLDPAKKNSLHILNSSSSLGRQPETEWICDDQPMIV